jgi:hypothetical protein
MKRTKRIAIMALAMTATISAASAQDKVESNISADFVNEYVWRGQDLGNVSIQPSASIAYKGLSIGAWGNVGIDKTDTKEFDLTAAYSVGGFNIGVTDYWFNTGQDDPNNRYFMYKAHQTNHVFEGNIGYNLGIMAIQWYTNFAGNDGTKSNDKRAYSSYCELSAPFKLGGLDWNAALGASPWETSFYGNSGFAIVNASVKATKSIVFSPSFSVPVFAQIATNPCSQKAYFVIGFTLHP